MTDRTLTVHKEGAEGTLQVNALTGRILTPVDDRPDWSEGLAACLPQSRITWYMKRLGEKHPTVQTIKDAEVVAFQDLDWVGVNADQQTVELDADPEFRMEAVTKVLGISEDGSEGLEGISYEPHSNRTRTRQEIEALDEGISQGFPDSNQEAAVKTGT
jgi:hypothetical protein